MSDGEIPALTPRTLMEFRVQSLEKDVKDLKDKFNVIDGKMDKINDRLKIIAWVVIGAGLAFNIIGPDMAELLKASLVG